MSTQQVPEQPQNVSRLDVLIQNFKDSKDNDDKCLKLLHDLFELMEHNTLVGGQFDSNMRQISELFLPMMLDKAKETAPQFIDSVKHRIRRQTLDILSIITFPDDKRLLPMPAIVDYVLSVIEHDNEENAEMALKLIYELQKFYRTTHFILAEVAGGPDRLLAHYLKVLSNLNERLTETTQTPEELVLKRQRQFPQHNGARIMTSSEQSMKTIVHFNSFYLWVNQIFSDALSKNILSILLQIVDIVLKPFSLKTQHLSNVKNVALYIEYLESLKNVLNFFNFIVKKSPRGGTTQAQVDLFVEHFPVVISAELNILRNLQQMGTSSIRIEILTQIKQQLIDVTTYEKQDKQMVGQNQQLRITRIDKGYYNQKTAALKSLFEDFLMKPTLTGYGKQSKDLCQISRQIQQNYIINMYREHFNHSHLRFAIQLTQRQMLDRTISLSLRQLMIINLYRLVDDLKLKRIDTLQDYSDLLENFAQQNRDLEYQMKIMAEEYKSMKGEIGELRKTSRVRLGNDNEQKACEIRNILIADSAAYFVDMSKEKSLKGGDENIAKFKHDYQYFYLHDYKPQQNLSDVTHQKENKFAFLSQYSDNQISDYMESNKEDNCLRLVKNMLSFQELLLQQIMEKQGSNYFKYRDIKSMRKILIHGSNVVHYLCDMYIVNQPGQPLQFQTSNDRTKIFEIIKKFGKLFFTMLPLQFRDLIASVEDKLLGRVIETMAQQGDSGIFLLVENMMQFQPQNQMNMRPGQPMQQPQVTAPAFLNVQDEYPAHLNEIFFAFIAKKMRIFNKPVGDGPGEKLLTTNKLDQRLAKIPTAELQDTLQKLTLIIAEKALSRKNDQRMKHLFFSIFIYCIKYTKTNKIIPYYFQVIKNTFKSLNSMSDNTNFTKEFTPMVQGLIETFLQAKEDASYIKETNELCYQIPVKLKSLIEFIPSMSRPLIDSMKLNQVEIIENGITTIQMWVSALSGYPEILDPILDNMLVELNSFLQKMNCVLPNLALKLLGKLSAKTRIYSEEREIRAKNLQEYTVLNYAYSPEEGLKITLQDKSTCNEITLPLDSAIGTILIKVFDQYHKYSEENLIQAYKLVKSCFLCYVEPSYDIDFLVLSIINAKTKNTELLTQYAMNSTRFFDSRRQQQKLSGIARGSEQHGFEKILKSILIASTIPKTNQDTKIFIEKIDRFFTWITQYFTLIYICKNGKLNECLANEINPLIFIDDLCEFLYFNLVQNTPKAVQRNYIQGPIKAIKHMIRFVREIYPPEELDQAYQNLEYIHILVKKICHVAYIMELPNKVAMNLALQAIIEDLPSSYIRVHCSLIIDAVFHTMNISAENIIYQVEKECKKTLDLILEKVGLYTIGLNGIDQDLKNQIMEKIILQLYSTKAPARNMSMYLIERIASRSQTISVKDLVTNALRPQREQQQQPVAGGVAQPAQMQQQTEVERSWVTHLVTGLIDAKAKSLFQMHLGGYSSVLNLISYLDLFQFLLKHQIYQANQKINLTLVISEQILKILENEIQKYETILYAIPQQNQQEEAQSPQTKSSIRYMKLEKLYLSQNKVYDPHSHTLHMETFSNTAQYFEVEELAKKDKLAQESEAVQYGYNYYGMFIQKQPQQQQGQPQAPPQIEVNPKFQERLSPQELDKLMKEVNGRINENIKKLFAQVIQASDISFDYIHHMYELYPNTRLHAELIGKCLTVLCDIAVEDSIHASFKQRSQVFFEQMQAYQNLQSELQSRLLKEYMPPASVGGSQQQAPMIQQLPQEQQKIIDDQLQNLPFFVGNQREASPHCCRKLDYYAVEIKSRIIAMFFKFFQREEFVIYKAAKKCLSRLIKKESNQQDALPNPILKECVRPSLNIISMRTQIPTLFEQLTRLIYVLHGCFNEQLGKHLIRSYEQSKPKFNEEFPLQMHNFKNQMSIPLGTLGEDGKTPMTPFSIESLSEQDRHRYFYEDVQRLIYHQNTRIEDIESTYHILKISYLLLQTYRHDIFKILLGVPQFEAQIVSELEKKFKDTYKQLCEFYGVPLVNQIVPEHSNYRPIAIKIGHLKSDYREGLLKYCNKNPFDVCDLLKSQAKKEFANINAPDNDITRLDLTGEAIQAKQGGASFYDYILDIANDPQSFCLRERFARDPDLFKLFLQSFDMVSNEFYFALKLIQILVKYNPNLLILNHFQQVIYFLRPKWLQLAEIDPTNLPNPSVEIYKNYEIKNLSLYRKVHTKLMKILIEYCRHPKAKINAIIDLAKGYRNVASIDMFPIREFFQFDIPYKISLDRAKELIMNITERIKIQNSNPHNPHMLLVMTTYESIAQYMDLIFIPLITRYSDTDQMFRSLIDDKFVYEFMDGIQGNYQNLATAPSRVDDFKGSLELSIHYSSEQFLVEIIKILNLIFRYFDLQVILNACPFRDIKKLNNFLYSCAKKSKGTNLVEWSFYSITSMFIRILNSVPAIVDTNPLNSEKGAQYKQLIDMIEYSADQVLMLILQHNNVMFFKAIVHKSFRNLIQIIDIVNQFQSVQHEARMQRDPTLQKLPFPQPHETVANALKEALKLEGRQQNSLLYLCSFILANSDQIYQYDYKFKFIQRINKIINKLTATNTMSLSSKQLAVELCATINNWARMRIFDYRQNKPGSAQIIEAYYNMGPSMFYNLARIAINVQISPHELQKDSLDLIALSLNQIRTLIHSFAGLPIYQIPMFDNLVQEQMAGDNENFQLGRLIMINIMYILCKYSQRKQDNIVFFFTKLQPVATRFPKGILFSCRLVNDIFQNQEQAENRQICDLIKGSIERDIKRCQVINFEDVVKAVKNIEDKYQADQKPPILSFQEQASCIMQVIPHYTIRLIDYYERTYKRPCPLIENESMFYRNLIQIILKVVINFRKHLVFDQDEASPSKLKFKHLVLHMTNNVSTKYTQAEGLVNLTDDIVEIKVDDTNFDMFNKETILIGFMLIARKLKKMQSEEAIYVLESLISCVQYISKFNINEYIIEGMRQVIDILIDDKPEDETRLAPEKKIEFVRYMVNKITDLLNERKDTGKTNELIVKIYDQAVRVLEQQTNLMQDSSLRLFEKLFIFSKGKPVALKHRVFQVFEKFNGTSIFKKLQFFFAKHLVEDDKQDKQAFFQAQSQLLDFTLFSFRANGDLKKIKHSSKFFTLYNLDVQIDNLISGGASGADQVMRQEDSPLESEYTTITKALDSFTQKSDQYKGLKIADLMNYISDLISNNLSYSYDKLISDKLFLFLFHQYWSHLLTREEQQIITEGINKHFLNCIQMASQSQQPNQQGVVSPIDPKKYSLSRMLLEAIAGVSPQIRVEPETLQLMGKTFNLWHVVLPILENHMTLFPDNERYFFATNELYEKLIETDYIAGLRRQVTKSQETRAMISYAQHDMWEEINQQFSHFLVYYAEQEGQYEQMDDDQKKPGKYQRQLSEMYMGQLQRYHEKFHANKYQQMKMNNPDLPQSEKDYVDGEMQKLNQDIENASGRNRFEQDKNTYQCPRRGPNNLVKEVDLRVWETIFTDSLKVLNRWDQYFDIARALAYNVDIPNLDMMIEYAWNQKDWSTLQTYEPILKSSESLKHRIYACYLAIRSQNIPAYDDVFKSIVQQAFFKWDLYLPKYIDNTVHFDNLTLYQLLMESSEGGRNFIKEIKDEKKRGKIMDFKVLANLWRERIPHMCERIQLWKDILENRNFLFDQFAGAMIPSPPVPEPAQPLTTEQENQGYRVQFFGVLNSQRQDFTNEYLDKCWNYYKLAQVSRRQDMPMLAASYLLTLDRQLKFSGPELPESLRTERFHYDYENLKNALQFNQNADTLKRSVYEAISNLDNVYILKQPQNEESHSKGVPLYEPYQIAAIQRLVGDYFFRVGTFDRAQKYYTDSITMYDKDYKAWLSFAKFNEAIYHIKKDEVSLQHVLKGYMTAISYALHKSRFIIPNVFTIIKKKVELSPQELQEPMALIKKMINQLPAWIWLFWLPQLLHMFYSNNNLELIFSRNVLEKLSKLYPQALYLPIKIKNEQVRIGSADEQRQINAVYGQQIQFLMGNIRRFAQQQIIQLDRLSQEFTKTMKPNQEEDLQGVLGKIFCMSSIFKIENFEKNFNTFLNQLHTRFFSPLSVSSSPLLAELAASFERDFINPDTKETNIIQVIKRAKHLKDLLQQRINLTEQRSYLELISPILANYCEKGIELPGQYMLTEQEPQPQSIIYIQKFDSQIYKGSSIQNKRILIKCSNQRQYGFTAQTFQMSKDDVHKMFNEERLNQVKIIMNMLFKKHKETARRSIKFYVPMRAIFNRLKIVQDDLAFQSMQEIQDFLFQEKGMDTDQAFNIQLRKVDETLKSLNSNLSEASISSLTPERKAQINEETFHEMQNLHCKPYLLSTFFHRIFYNVDELFLFKKYFTVHHAVNSFFAYVFSQVDLFTLNQMSVSKTSGCLTFNEAKMIEFIKNRNLRKAVNNLNVQPNIDYEALEREEMQVPTYLPFRLSNNFVDLMGARASGLHGMFAGVLTSCSLAMGKQHEKLLPLLSLVYRDDLNDDRDGNLLLIAKSVEYIKYKMCSLSQNKNILGLEQYMQDPEYVKVYKQVSMMRLDSNHVDQSSTQIVEPENLIMFGNIKLPAEAFKYEVNKPNVMEEFNKKVFDLIDMAVDEKRLCQMPSSWNAWF